MTAAINNSRGSCYDDANCHGTDRRMAGGSLLGHRQPGWPKSLESALEQALLQTKRQTLIRVVSRRGTRGAALSSAAHPGPTGKQTCHMASRCTALLRVFIFDVNVNYCYYCCCCCCADVDEVAPHATAVVAAAVADADVSTYRSGRNMAMVSHIRCRHGSTARSGGERPLLRHVHGCIDAAKTFDSGHRWSDRGASVSRCDRGRG